MTNEEVCRQQFEAFYCADIKGGPSPVPWGHSWLESRWKFWRAAWIASQQAGETFAGTVLSASAAEGYVTAAESGRLPPNNPDSHAPEQDGGIERLQKDLRLALDGEICPTCFERGLKEGTIRPVSAVEPGAAPEHPFAWCRERVPVGYHIHVGDWPPPEPDDTAWQPLYLTPGGRPAPVEPGGRPVRPHRSGGQPVAPVFRDERLHRIDRLMDAQPGTPEGAELDKLVDEQVNAEKSGGGQ
jgi:hypothetical protein